jgi:hypothetical protein
MKSELRRVWFCHPSKTFWPKFRIKYLRS